VSSGEPGTKSLRLFEVRQLLGQLLSSEFR
jgi:hypothetical protein